MLNILTLIKIKIFDNLNGDWGLGSLKIII